MDWFPRFYALGVEKKCLIIDRWRESGWSWNWNREIRGGATAKKLSTLTDLLSHVELGVGSE